MARKSSKGICNLCGESFSKAGMSKHLAACPARMLEHAAPSSPAPATGRKARPGDSRFLHLLVEGRGVPEYWLHLKMPATATLADLDDFLRQKWLECCGHLSAFEINGQSYVSTIGEEWGMDEKSMDSVKLGKVLSAGQMFKHEYDFGTTTELKLKVVNERTGLASKGDLVELLAENDEPEVLCGNCGKIATQVCGECIYEGESWVCDDCAETHECGEEMLLPVVNSPRVGMCAYSG